MDTPFDTRPQAADDNLPAADTPSSHTYTHVQIDGDRAPVGTAGTADATPGEPEHVHAADEPETARGASAPADTDAAPGYKLPSLSLADVSGERLRSLLLPHRVILALILLAGAALRYYGINWDGGTGLHPDERFLTSVVQGLRIPASWSQFLTPGHVSPLEPTNFNYGSLPAYLYWIVGHIAVWLGSWVPGLASWQNALGSGVYTTGRAVSAMAGVVTIEVVYLIGLRAYSRAAGLLAAAFFAVCVLDVQLSHFLTVDPLTTLFATLAVYACVRIAGEGRAADYLWAGVWIGAALACKVSVPALLLILVVAPFLPRPGAQSTASADGAAAQVVRGWGRVAYLAVAGVAALVVFFVTQPYALIDWNNYVGDVLGQARLASGTDHVFYTDKFYGTPPFWYHIEHIVPWDLGWPLGLAAMAGVVVAVWRSLTRRRLNGEIVVALWTLAYFASTGGQFMKYLRYMLPIMPALCLLAAAVLLPATQRLRSRRERAQGARPATLRAQGQEGLPPPQAARAYSDTPLQPTAVGPRFAMRPRSQAGAGPRFAMRPRSQAGAPRWRALLALGVLALTALYALAYDNIYSAPNTRLQASAWMERHIKPGTPYTTEGQFDEGLPWGAGAAGYNGVSISTVSGGDTGQAWLVSRPQGPGSPPLPSISAALADSQYVTISSDRIMGTVPHLPQAFPYASRYYCLLFGRTPPAGFHCPRVATPYPLGFKLVAHFENHPHLFGVSLDDYMADQNFSEYDHPPVWIFQRVRPMSEAQTAALITDNGRVHDAPTVATPDKSLLLTPKELAANAKGPAYGREFPANSLANRLPALVWLVWIELLGLLALPLTLRLFRRLPDRGVVLGKTVGLLLVGYLTWLGATLHLASFNRPLILGAAVLVGVASLLWGVPRREIGRFWREKRGLVLAVEGVFLASFVADVIVRMLYPDMWHAWNGGEKPMDVSYLNGLVRSQTLPPSDPWFGGGYINYYYYGYVLVAALIKLTGVAPNLAYNLAVPTLFALTLATVYTLGYALTRRVGVGLLAAGLAVLAGNLYTGVQMVATLISVSPLQLAAPVLGGVVGFVGGLWQVATQQLLLHHQVFPAIGFRTGLGWGWDSTRVIDGGGTINEFPFFTFLYADLHAHMMDMPALLACVALAANAAFGARPWLGGGAAAGARRAVGRALAPGAGAAMLLITAVIIGATGPTNSWDLPTALIVVALGVAVNVYAGSARPWPALLSGGVFAVVGGVLALGLYYPFYEGLKSFYSSIGVTLAHTQLSQFLVVWGLFLFILTTYIGLDLWRGLTGAWLRRQFRAAEFVLFYWPRRARVRPLLMAVGRGLRANGHAARPALSLVSLGAGVALAIVALLLGAPVLALLLLLLGAALGALLEPRHIGPVTEGEALTPRSRGFVLALTVLALALTAICEFAYLADFLAGSSSYRMNTVFKLYEQAWLLFAVAAAPALLSLLETMRLPLSWPRLALPSLGANPALGIVATNARSTVRGGRAEVLEREAPTPLLPRLWLGALGALLVAVALYPIIETPLRVADRTTAGYWNAIGNPSLGPTLDGTAFVQKAFPGEYKAMTWLNNNVPGDPIVLTSQRGGYESFAFRVQWMTGLPSIVQGGWEESQQRYNGQIDKAHWPYAPYPMEVTDRETDVTAIYSTTDTTQALQLLHKYNVRYIYVGIAERGEQGPSPASGCFAYGSPYITPNTECVGYPLTGLAKFDTMAQQGTLQRVYDQDGVAIYKVVK